MSNTSGLGEEKLSGIIGEIYDCVVDPTRWEATFDRLRDLLDCMNCTIEVVDLRRNTTRFVQAVGIDPQLYAQAAAYKADIVEAYAQVPAARNLGIGEPHVLRREMPWEILSKNRYFREWATPQGIVDLIQLTLMRSEDRFASLALGRHERFGLINDREVRLLRLLAPHLCRAVTISDLIEMKSIKAEALAQTLDTLSAGVVLVTEDAEILHANRAADRMIEEAAPIRSAAGRLSASDAAATRRLHHILEAAAGDEAEIGDAGIGLALNDHEGSPATAHVLPIAHGELRSRLAPRGVAAVFVSSEGEPQPAHLDGVAKAYGLSRAETRVLQRLVQGDSLAEAAVALDIAASTAKTHLARLFAKTGARRQAGLIALVNRLMPPVAPPRQ